MKVPADNATSAYSPSIDEDRAAMPTPGRDARRSVQRFKIFQPGRLEHDKQEIKLHLLDISKAGARAYSEVPPCVGTVALITAGESFGLGRVIWVNGKMFGMKFGHAISRTALDRVIGAPLPGLGGPLKVVSA